MDNRFVVFLFSTVHLVDMTVASEAFERHGLRGQNDKLIEVTEMIECLSSMYEQIAAQRSTSSVPVDVPLCVDLVLNWILNVYDTYVGCVISIRFWLLFVTITTA